MAGGGAGDGGAAQLPVRTALYQLFPADPGDLVFAEHGGAELQADHSAPGPAVLPPAGLQPEARAAGRRRGDGPDLLGDGAVGPGAGLRGNGLCVLAAGAGP